MKANILNKAKGMVKVLLPFYLFTFLPLTAMSQDNVKTVTGVVTDAATVRQLIDQTLTL